MKRKLTEEIISGVLVDKYHHGARVVDMKTKYHVSDATIATIIKNYGERFVAECGVKAKVMDEFDIEALSAGWMSAGLGKPVDDIKLGYSDSEPAPQQRQQQRPAPQRR